MNYGGIFWDLGINTEYAAGMTLPCHLIVVNTTEETRDYKILAMVTDKDNKLLDSGNILLNDEEWFSLDAGQAVEIPGFIVLQTSNCNLELRLHIKREDVILASPKSDIPMIPVASCYTYLYAPGLLPSETNIWQLVAGGMMLAMVSVMTVKMITGGKS